MVPTSTAEREVNATNLLALFSYPHPLMLWAKPEIKTPHTPLGAVLQEKQGRETIFKASGRQHCPPLGSLQSQRLTCFTGEANPCSIS